MQSTGLIDLKRRIFRWIIRGLGVKAYIRIRSIYGKIMRPILHMKDRSSEYEEWVKSFETINENTDCSNCYYIPGAGKKRYFVVRFPFPETGLIAACRHYMWSYLWLKQHRFIPIMDLEFAVDQKTGKLGEYDFFGELFWQKTTIKDALSKGNVYVGAQETAYYDGELLWDMNGGDGDNCAKIKCYSDTKHREYYRTWFKITKSCFSLREDIYREFDADYHSFMNKKMRVLGVMMREDFTNEINEKISGKKNRELRKGHPINPSVDSMIDQICDKYQEWRCEYIFVSTRYENTLERLKQRIGADRILFLDRCRSATFVDEMFLECEDIDKKNTCDIEEAKKNNKAYLKDIYFLTKCRDFIGCVCGGTQAVLVMNAGKFKHVHVFSDSNASKWSPY